MDRPEITQKFEQLGGAARLGDQLGSEADAVRRGEEPPVGKAHPPPHSGRVRHYENGSIYWHKTSGAHAVFGLIRQKWQSLGAHRSVLEFPVSDEVKTAAGDGMKTTFEGGVVTWRSGAKEAFELHGAIWAKYSALGGTKGLLGYPITDETGTPDGVGRFNHFEHGSIYFKPTIGAHEVHGLIRSYWAEEGWERNGVFGYPISDELPAAPGSPDRYNDFENGVIYWKSGAAAATWRAPDGNFSVPSRNVPGLAAANITNIMKKVNENIAASNPPVSVTVNVSEGPEYYEFPGEPSDELRTSDYRWDGSRVVNRRHAFHLELDVDIDDMPNPSVDMRINVEVNLNRARTAVVVRPTSFSATTDVDFPLSMAVSAEELNEKLKKAMENVESTIIPAMIPPDIQVLSVKTMVGGNILVFR